MHTSSLRHTVSTLRDPADRAHRDANAFRHWSVRRCGCQHQTLRRATRALRTAQAMVRELRNMALHDALTGLPNRHHLEQFWAGIDRRTDAATPEAGLLVIDIDAFKSVNDNHSHAVGDAVLKSVAGVLRTQMRQGDLVARTGGDEFICVLSGADALHCAVVAQRLREAVALHDWRAVAPELHVSVSVGVACGQPTEGLQALVHAADLAMYDDKLSSRQPRGIPNRDPSP